jgi:hypothetical protein
MKLYHCVGARSFRPLWALEEIGLPYELAMLPFPPHAEVAGAVARREVLADRRRFGEDRAAIVQRRDRPEPTACISARRP